MRILVTGAGGMLGHDVRAVAERAGHETVALTRTELDIRDLQAVQAAVSAAGPQVIINCAAWTDVDGAEADYDGALAVNGDGAGTLARAAVAAGAWTVHLSTDYVFDGVKREPYLESDPPSPVSAYGRSKLRGEQQVAQAAPDRHTIVRASWLFGLAGPCFPKTILKLARERDELRVVDDQIGVPTYAGHLAEALVGLAGTAVPPVGVLHVSGGGECSWFQFAREIVAGAGVPCRLVPCTTEEFPRPAARPAYSVLRSERGAPSLPNWREGLNDFLTAVEVPA
jgi:dTDP-4-dehydrorhamnose reductase